MTRAYLLPAALLFVQALKAQAPTKVPGLEAFLATATQAAEGGQAEAQYALGMLHEDAVGVPQDHRQAFMWLEKAAKQGHAEAQYQLAALYRNGHGTDQDLVAATSYLRLAAQQGHVRGQRVLAHELQFGRAGRTGRGHAEG